MPRGTPNAVVDASEVVSQVEGTDPRDSVLENFKEFRVKALGKRMGPLDEFLRVHNLPADRCVTWATDPRIDNGRHLAFIKGLGFRPVEIDEVTTDPNVEAKLVVNQFDEGPHRTVLIGGGVLMIGYRQYREDRKANERDAARAQVAQQQEKMDSMGIRHGGQISRGGLTEV